jgi:hypothetical protein
MTRKPIVLGDDTQLQQLQQSDDLKIPLEEQVQKLQQDVRVLCSWLVNQGFELPDDLIS